MTVWLLVLMSLGTNAVLPVTFSTKVACEALGNVLLDGLRWACVEVAKPSAQG